MKYLVWFVGVVVVVIGVIYTLLFTSLGNGIVKPLVETEIQKQVQLPSHLKRFSLGFSNIDIILELNPGNTITVEGTYSLFAQSFDLNYDISLNKLATLESLTKKKLQDSFHTHGNVVGDIKFLTLKGESNVAKSNTNYKVELNNLQATLIIAKITDLDLASLLHMLGEKEYAEGRVDLNMNFKDIRAHQLDGDIVLLTKKGKLNSTVMKKDFGIVIPKTSFKMNLNAKLKGDDVDYKYLLNSNLAKISSSGNIKPEPLAVDIKYGLHIAKLEALKPVTNTDLRGALKLSGTLKGNKEDMLLLGKSDIAASNTTFGVNLKEFTPKSAQFSIQHLKLQKLLYMLKQPHYADALIDIKGDIKNADMKKLDGTIHTTVTKGLLDSRYLTKAYEFKSMMPKTKFNLVADTDLDKSLIKTNLTLNSTLADLRSQEICFDMNDASLESDYRVDIKDLDKLYFVTDRHLKGAISANGDVKKAKDLDFTMHSDVAGGKLDAKLHNDDFHADIDGLRTLDILDILIYPKIFKSKIDAELDYNLATSKGEFNGFLSDGVFTRNQVLDLTKQYAHIDLYKQKFKGDIGAKINKENIFASLDLKSNTSSIVTKNTYINSKKNYIKSVIDITANKHPLSVKLSGNIQKPKVEVDASQIIKKEASKAVSKELEKRLGKDAGNILKGLF